MGNETWLVIGGVVVAAVAWVGRYFGWFTAKAGRQGIEDPSSTMQGSVWTPPDAGSHHSHHGGGDAGGFGGGHHS